MDWIINHWYIVIYSLALVGSHAGENTIVRKISDYVLSGRPASN